MPLYHQSLIYNMGVQMTVCHSFSVIGTSLPRKQALPKNAQFDWLVHFCFNRPIGEAFAVYKPLGTNTLRKGPSSPYVHWFAEFLFDITTF